MTGEYQHSLDAKGRLCIPSKLRDDLGETFYVTIGLDRCLSVYPMNAWDKVKEKFNCLPITQARRMRMIFANAARCELDSQGRILLPQKLRDYAEIKKDVTVIGVSDHAEIWDSERYQAFEEESMLPENLAAVMEELGF